MTEPENVSTGTPVRERSGAQMIAAERQRQVDAEHWTADHDDTHVHGELSTAAACYAREAHYAATHSHMNFPPRDWPWERGWWKPTADPVRDLVKAGALIAAEIDRLQRRSDA